MVSVTRPLEEVFWRRVDVGSQDKCWPILRGVGSNGYGYFRRRLAHRIAYELAIGPIPYGLFVCHRCDNPRCCNPRHLWLGTNRQNMLDAIAKGRALRGSRNGQAKLTESIVRELRQRYAAGETSTALAPLFGVSPRAVRHAVNRTTWRHVVVEPESVQLALAGFR